MRLASSIRITADRGGTSRTMVLMLRDGDDTRLFILSQERGEDRPLFASAAGGRQTAWTPLAFRMTAGRLRHRADSWSTRRSHPDEHVFGTFFWEYYLAGDLVSVDGLIAELPGAVPFRQAGECHR